MVYRFLTAECWLKLVKSTLKDHLKILLDIEATSRTLIHDASITPDISSVIRIELIRLSYHKIAANIGVDS